MGFSSIVLGLVTACGGEETAPASGWFETGQAASLLLGGVDFDDSGGPLLFNHPKGIATDGTRLALADGNNNRVLIWNTLPDGNVEPDVVLGQQNFVENDSGSGPGEMNWPVAVSLTAARTVIADTYNHRVLIWNRAATTGSEPDLILEGMRDGDMLPFEPRRDRFVWPWAVWTDDEKLIVVSTAAGILNQPEVGGGVTGGGWVLIWNTFPTSSTQPADIVLSDDGTMVTPRSIATDGETYLHIGDHGNGLEQRSAGNWIWNSFPTEDEVRADAYLLDPVAPWIWMGGTQASTGQYLAMGSTLHVWDAPPTGEEDGPSISLHTREFNLRGGDGSTVATAQGRVYVSDYNANRVVGYNAIPTSADALPDFVIGAESIQQDVFAEHHFITNAIPVSDGESLLIGDGYDRRLHCWQVIPERSAEVPDATFQFMDGVSALAMHRDTVVAAGPMSGIRVWHSLPCGGEEPDMLFSNQIGTVSFTNISGVAIDDTAFYLVADNRLYVFEGGIPSEGQAPTAMLPGPYRGVDTDGEHLALSIDGSIHYLTVGDWTSPQEVPSIGWSQGLGSVELADGHAFVVDHNFNRVYAWQSKADFFMGVEPDAILGASDLSDVDPEVSSTSLFWPQRCAWDGRRLWVGEYKFSGRIVAFELP